MENNEALAAQNGMSIEDWNESCKRNYMYETKCRRCGNLTWWVFSSTKQVATNPHHGLSYMGFCNAMIDKIQYPRTNHCAKCEFTTVQDVTAYSDPDRENG